MKPAEQITFDRSSFQFVEGKISLKAPHSKDRRQTDLVYSIDELEHVEPDFPSWIYSPSSQSLVPTVEAIRWGNFLLAFGRRSCLVFDREAGLLVGTVALHRRDTDDAGFYSVNFQDADDLLVVVYEGGIFAVDSTGILWHRQKIWDDLATSIDAHTIVVNTGDEGCYTLDSRTGWMR